MTVFHSKSLTAINNEDEVSFEHETSINEVSVDGEEPVCSVSAWATGLERLLGDEIGVQVFTEFLKKEFSQENVQFWVECEKLKKLTDQEQVRRKDFLYSVVLTLKTIDR